MVRRNNRRRVSL